MTNCRKIAVLLEKACHYGCLDEAVNDSTSFRVSRGLDGDLRFEV